MKKKIVALSLLLPLLFNLLTFTAIDILPKPNMIGVRALSLETEDLFFDKLGTSRQVVATITPTAASNKEIIWTTSDASVATVENGLVTAHNNGTAYINAAAKDGNYSASCLVSVMSQYVESFAVYATLDDETLDLSEEINIMQDQSVDLRIEVTSVNALKTAEPVVLSTDGAVMSASGINNSGVESINGKNTLIFETSLNALRVGKATLTVKAPAAMGEDKEHNIEFNVLPDYSAGIRLNVNGRNYTNQSQIKLASTSMQISLNRPPELLLDASFEVEPVGESIPAATIVFDEESQTRTLEFINEGVVKLNYTCGEESGSCLVSSTFGRIEEAALNETLEPLKAVGIEMSRSKALNFSILPEDYALFYDFEWTVPQESRAYIKADSSAATSVSISSLGVYDESRLVHAFTLTLTGKQGTISQAAEPITHTFTVTISILGLTSLDFELNKPQYVKGYEKTYVFGNTHINGGDYSHNIRINKAALQSADNTVLFEIVNEEERNYAEIDEYGKITFKPFEPEFAGQTKTVTVRARSKHSFDGNYAQAEYTFSIVSAVNVLSADEFIVANNLKFSIVLHNNLSFNAPISVFRSVFGNGFIMDMQAYTATLNDMSTVLFTFMQLDLMISKTVRPQVVTNVTFIGFETDNLVDLQKKGILVDLYENYTLQYCRIEGAATLMQVRVTFSQDKSQQELYPYHLNRDITVYRCLLKNAGYTGAFLADSDNVTAEKAENIVFEDLIFERCLAGIIFSLRESTEADDKLELTLKGFIKFYTWIKKTEADKLKYTFGDIDLELSLFGLPTTDYNKTPYYYLPIVTPNARLYIPFVQDISYVCKHAFDQPTTQLLNDNFSIINRKYTLTLSHANFTYYAPKTGTEFYVSIQDQLSLTTQQVFAMLAKEA